MIKSTKSANSATTKVAVATMTPNTNSITISSGDKNKFKNTKQFVIGGVSGIFAKTSVAPLERLRFIGSDGKVENRFDTRYVVAY